MAREAAHNVIRVATRLSVGFVLDLAKLGGFGRDVIDGLLLAAISQANVAQITRSPELQRLYATLDQAPPDSLRRPVSISAVANSLRIPFETARRRISALTDLGVVIGTPKGVIIPQAPLTSHLYRANAQAHYDLVRTLYLRLRRVGLFADLARPPASPPFEPDNPPIRLVVRHSTDFLLRLAEPISIHIGDVLSGLIVLEVFHANTEHLSDDEGGAAAGDWSADGFVDDSLRRPIRPVALSDRLAIPAETIRRHLARLVESGRCERRGDGYIVPARILAREALIQFLPDNQSHLHRLFAALGEYGVLAEWETAVSAYRGAA